VMAVPSAKESTVALAKVNAVASAKVPVDLAHIRGGVLAARDARQARLDSFFARAGGRGCVVAVSTVIPGVDKRPAGAELLVGAAWELLCEAGWVRLPVDWAPSTPPGSTESTVSDATSADATSAEGTSANATSADATSAHATSEASSFQWDHGVDVLGEFLLVSVSADARRLKERCVALESATPWGRLLDLDVYDSSGRPVARRVLGLAERKCLICDEAARDCIRLGRHRGAELRDRVASLLGSVNIPV
jgi:holo-ACP synthase CitX